MEELFSRDAGAMRPSPIRALAKITADPVIISLAGGHPSPDAFPLGRIGEILAGMANNLDPASLQYGPTAGNAELRREIVGLLGGRGIAAGDEEVILCSGSQRGLDLLGRVLLDPGDAVLIEVPSYPGAIACFRNLRARLVGVQQDEDGLRIDELESVLRGLRDEGVRPKLLYTVPTFQNPSGATLAADRRLELLEISRREGFMILEDDPYSELYFDEGGADGIRPIAAADAGDVIYLSSFSKILSPGLRTAFIRGPRELIARVELAAQACDICSSSLDQQIVLELCRGDFLPQHLAGVRRLYSEHGEALLAALDESMPQGVEWNRPRGGFFLWMRLPERIDAEEMLGLAIERGVAYVSGRHFCVDGSGRNALRLTFSKESPERLQEGAKILANVIRDELSA